MSQGVDEVETAVHAMVFDVPPVQTRLVSKILVILLIAVVNDRLPAVMKQWRRGRGEGGGERGGEGGGERGGEEGERGGGGGGRKGRRGV